MIGFPFFFFFSFSRVTKNFSPLWRDGTSRGGTLRDEDEKVEKCAPTSHRRRLDDDFARVLRP